MHVLPLHLTLQQTEQKRCKTNICKLLLLLLLLLFKSHVVLVKDYVGVCLMIYVKFSQPVHPLFTFSLFRFLYL